MKNLLLILLALALSLPATAQEEIQQRIDRSQDKMAKPGMQADIDQPKVNNSDFERMVNTRLMVDFRKSVIETLELSEDEIIKFDPIFDDYQRDKEAITARRRNLVDKYHKEMSEDDTQADERDETGDFIENYWELDIANMELKKEYFDRLEEEIGSRNALRFMAMDAGFQDRVDRLRLMRAVPALVVLEPNYVSYQEELDAFSRWSSTHIEGKVSPDHTFIAQGLDKLLNAVEAMKNAEGLSLGNFTASKGLILEKAKAMQADRQSNQHADYAADALQRTADLLQEVAAQNQFSVPEGQIDRLQNAAKSIDPHKMLTDQQEHVYTFFNSAEDLLNDLVRQNKEGRSFQPTNR